VARVWKWPPRGGEEDVTTTTAECDGDGRFFVDWPFVARVWKWPPRGGEEDATTTTAECDGDGRFVVVS
jgi:hypothetical protein